MERLSAYPRAALWVLEGNENDIRFYERYGFRFDGTAQELTLEPPVTERRMFLDR